MIGISVAVDEVALSEESIEDGNVEDINMAERRMSTEEERLYVVCRIRGRGAGRKLKRMPRRGEGGMLDA